MIILDTCALIFDALSPKKLTISAKKAITQAENKDRLFCCDISLWEIAMLIEKKRIHVHTDTQNFLQIILQARSMQVLSINPEIAALFTDQKNHHHFDPADRLIVATTIHHKASLITSDKKLRTISDLAIIW